MNYFGIIVHGLLFGPERKKQGGKNVTFFFFFLKCDFPANEKQNNTMQK